MIPRPQAVPRRQEAGGESERPQVSGIRGSFMIFDAMIEQESATNEECALFFHPQTLPDNQQLFLMGYVKATVAFVNEFSGGRTVEVINMNTSKIAVARLPGDVTVALTGRAKDSDFTIKEHLADILRAVSFFHGSIQDVMRRVEGQDRATVQKAVVDVGRELLPLIKNYQNNVYSAFNPVPYTVLPEHSKRVIIHSSALLREVSMISGNHGACLLNSSCGSTPSVLCTQLPSDVTRWITCRVARLPESTQERESSLTFHCLVAEQVMGEDASPVDAQLVEQLELPPLAKGQHYAGVLLVNVEHLTLAVLMDISRIHSAEHIDQCISISTQKMLSLVRKLASISNSVGVSSRELPFHFLQYDSFTNTTLGTPPAPENKLYDKLLTQSNRIHDFFAENDRGISEVVLRDHDSSLLCRRMMSKELYYQQAKSDEDVVLEAKARANLAEMGVIL